MHDRTRVESYLADARSPVFVDDASRPTIATLVPGTADINVFTRDDHGKANGFIRHQFGKQYRAERL